MIKSHELIPFVDSLRYLTNKYYYGEPRELYDYRGRPMPTMLDEMRHYLEHDDSILTTEQLHDVSLSAEHLTKYCLPAADTPEKQAELWHVYELTRTFFLNHMDDLSKATRESIKMMEQVRTERIKN